MVNLVSFVQQLKPDSLITALICHCTALCAENHMDGKSRMQASSSKGHDHCSKEMLKQGVVTNHTGCHGTLHLRFGKMIFDAQCPFSVTMFSVLLPQLVGIKELCFHKLQNWHHKKHTNLSITTVMPSKCRTCKTQVLATF